MCPRGLRDAPPDSRTARANHTPAGAVSFNGRRISPLDCVAGAMYFPNRLNNRKVKSW
jgi:hypothetical protein